MKCWLWLALWPMWVSAQVGINTNAPAATLDVVASDPGAPAPSDGLLIPRVSALSALSPGALQHSMLVFLTTTQGIRTPGFYYWDDSLPDWVKLSSALESQWTDGGGFLYPTAGSTTDVSVGLTSSSGLARLQLLSTNRPYGIINQVTDMGGPTLRGLFNQIEATSGDGIGVYNFFPTDGNQFGVHNAMASSLGDKTGMVNYMNGTGMLRGMANHVLGDSFQGVYNDVSHGGLAYGMYTIFQPTDAGTSFGTYTQFSGWNSMANYGAYNQFGNVNTPLQYGQFNNFSFLGSGDHWGQYNLFQNVSGSNTGVENQMWTTGADRAVGLYNQINGGTIIYGVHNQLVGDQGTVGMYSLISGNGSLAGTVTHFENSSSLSEVYGYQVDIANSLSGPGNKYGLYANIESGAGGNHYGVFSQVTKPGSYAGYFVGNVRTQGELTVGDFNPYTFPVADGPAGAQLITDGSGQANWSSGMVKPYTTTGTSTGAYFLDSFQYTVRVFNGVSSVVLPAAASNPGRIFIIIGSNGIAPKSLTTLGGIIYDDVTQSFINTINANQRFMLQSDGIDWIVIGN